jgi:hypothetical protein
MRIWFRIQHLWNHNQFCGSGMFIPDQNFSIRDQGSKIVQIPDLDFFPILHPGSATLTTTQILLHFEHIPVIMHSDQNPSIRYLTFG